MSKVYRFDDYDGKYFATSCTAGALGTMVTHTSMTPFDVVKTRQQIAPQKYPWNPVTAARILGREGVPLFTGGVPTALGYLGQGCGKFGGNEYFKIKFAQTLGDEKAWENRVALTLASSAIAETITDVVWLCPFEAIRIKQVNNPGLSVAETARKALAEEGLLSFYSGLGPILMKQVPYTMAKFAVQDVLRPMVCPLFGQKDIDALNKAGYGPQIGVALTSGFGAGVAAALVSHPADTLLTLMNSPSKELKPDASTIDKAKHFIKTRGIGHISTVALATRFLHVGLLTAGQFLVFDVGLHSLGFEKFHFIDPHSKPDKHGRRLTRKDSLAV
jgi:solute carrier family 25 phosphate transporter 3